MGKAKLKKELFVTTANKVGVLAEITSAIAGTKANIEAICAYAIGSEACFRIVTSNNAKAASALKRKGYKVDAKDVVAVELENKVGAGARMAKKLKKAGIDLTYIYGTTCDCGCPCPIVFASDNNAKAVKALR